MQFYNRMFTSAVAALLPCSFLYFTALNLGSVRALELPYDYYDKLRSIIPARNVTVLKGDSEGKAMHLVDNKGHLIRLCHIPMFFQFTGSATEKSSESVTNDGSHAASAGALLAIHHFNNGISSVVPLLENITEICNIRLTTEVFDTEYSHHKALQDLLNITIERDSQLTNPKPFAILGSSLKQINNKLTAITEQYDLVHVSPIVTEYDRLDQLNLPLFTRINPTDVSWIDKAVEYLTERLEVRYIGILRDDTKEGENFASEVRYLQGKINKEAPALKHKCGGNEVKNDVVIEEVTIALSKSGWSNETEENLRRDIAAKFTNNPRAGGGFKYFVGYFKPDYFETVIKICYEEGIIASNETKDANETSEFWLFKNTPTSINDENIMKAINGSYEIRYEGATDYAYELFKSEWEIIGGKMSEYIQSKQPHSGIKYNTPILLSRDAFYSYDAMIGMGLAACGIRNRTKGNGPLKGNGPRPLGPEGNGPHPPGTIGNGPRPLGPEGNGPRPPRPEGNGPRPPRPEGNGPRPPSPEGYPSTGGNGPPGGNSQARGNGPPTNRPDALRLNESPGQLTPPVRSPATRSIDKSGYITGAEHYRNFVEAEFTGATGQVIIDKKRGVRKTDTVPYSVRVVETDYYGTVNLIEVEYFEATTNALKSKEGRKKRGRPSDKIMAKENKNQMPWRIRGVGWAMCAVSVTTSIGFIVVTYVRREHRVIVMSQPIFLRTVALGSLIFSSSIIPLSIDDGLTNTRSCNIACNATYWLICVGFTMMFSALFSKLWRILKLLSSVRNVSRPTVGVIDVMGPFAIFMGSNVMILTVQTTLHPIPWVRKKEECDEYNQLTATHGYCDHTKFVPYGVVLLVVNVTALIAAMVAAYKSKDMSTELQESRNVGLATLFVFETVLFLFPVLALMENQPNARFLVTSTSIFLVSMAVLLFVFVPKVCAVRNLGPRGVSTRNLFYTAKTTTTNSTTASIVRASMKKNIRASFHKKNLPPISDNSSQQNL